VGRVSTAVREWRVTRRDQAPRRSTGVRPVHLPAEIQYDGRRLLARIPKRTDNDRSPRRAERQDFVPSATNAETTLTLIERVKQGDADALETLVGRMLPLLRRWARGRLPAYARDLKETQDIVQECLIDALRRLPQFEIRGEGALQAYLRQAVANRIKNEIRRVQNRPFAVDLDDRHIDRAAGPLEAAIGNENIERYEAALQGLKPADRELVVGRLELQLSYEQLAAATGKPSANAARVAVIRAVCRLVEDIKGHD
jgi:RNA polymerase sigma factor (sigma-70 family)